MEMRPTSKFGAYLANAGVVACCVVFLFWLNSSARAKRSYPPPRPNHAPELFRVERQRDAYEIYRRAGLRGAQVVQVNRFLNMVDYFPAEELKNAPYPIPVADIRPNYEKGIDSHNWLFVAAETGMVRSVFVALPDAVYAERTHTFAGDPWYTVRGATISGYTYDIPLTITTLTDLPHLEEPVIVNVDAGYFTAPADPERIVHLLRDRCADIRMIVLVASTDEPGVTAAMKEALRRFEVAWRRL